MLVGWIEKLGLFFLIKNWNWFVLWMIVWLILKCVMVVGWVGVFLFWELKINGIKYWVRCFIFLVFGLEWLLYLIVKFLYCRVVVVKWEKVLECWFCLIKVFMSSRLKNDVGFCCDFWLDKVWVLIVFVVMFVGCNVKWGCRDVFIVLCRFRWYSILL